MDDARRHRPQTCGRIGSLERIPALRMSRNRPTGRAFVLLSGVAAVAAAAWGVSIVAPAQAETAAGEHPTELTGIDRARAYDSDAHAEGAQTATSVCDAQRLKAAKAKNPALEIVIPPEFDRQFPSLAACESHDLAWDEEAEGPMQPIPFSNAHHAGMYEIECLYCHSGTDRSQAAGMPSVELCMGCHANFPKEYDELEGIQILKKHWEEKTPVGADPPPARARPVPAQPAHLGRTRLQHLSRLGGRARRGSPQAAAGARHEMVGLRPPDPEARNGLVHQVPPTGRGVAGLPHLSLLGAGRTCLSWIVEVF